MNDKEKNKNIRNDLKTRVKEFIKQYHKESDRAAVILCAAKMDLLLHHALKARMLPNPSGRDELLDSDRALGTFSARTTAAYRLGLINASLSRVLHIFRRLRNEFAHEVADSKLSDGSHKDRIRELIQPIRDTTLYSDLRDILKNSRHKSDVTRIDFLIATALIVSRLEVLCDTVVSINADNPVPYNKESP